MFGDTHTIHSQVWEAARQAVLKAEVKLSAEFKANCQPYKDVLEHFTSAADFVKRRFKDQHVSQMIAITEEIAKSVAAPEGFVTCETLKDSYLSTLVSATSKSGIRHLALQGCFFEKEMDDLVAVCIKHVVDIFAMAISPSLQNEPRAQRYVLHGPRFVH